MQLLRKILFYVFSAAYIVICPLLILYAFGFIYRPGTAAGYIKTGLIYLSTAPSGAAIIMNGSKYTRTTPASIRELVPGEYRIRLEYDGYRDWEQTVPVAEEKATVLDKVLLVPDKWESETILEGTFDELISSASPGYFIALKEKRILGEALVLDISSEKASVLCGKGSPYSGYTVKKVLTRGKSGYILVEALDEDKKRRFLWKNLTAFTEKFKDITDLVPADYSICVWAEGQDNNMFFLTDDVISRVDASAGAVYPGIIRKVKGVGVRGGTIYTVGNDGRVAEYAYDGTLEKTLLDDLQVAREAFGARTEYEIMVVSPELLLFVGNDGSLSANKLPYRFIDKGVKGGKIDASGERALVFTSEKIGILDFGAETTGDTGFELGPKMTWIYQGGQDIAQAEWIYDDSHVLFRDKNQVFVVEDEPFGVFPVTRVFTIKRGSSFVFSEKTGAMYSIDKTDLTLRSAELVPVKHIISTPFPNMRKEDRKLGIEELSSGG